ncbi:hypothetical protein AB0H89_38420 [Catellatospora methionotrophica]
MPSATRRNVHSWRVADAQLAWRTPTPAAVLALTRPRHRLR